MGGVCSGCVKKFLPPRLRLLFFLGWWCWWFGGGGGHGKRVQSCIRLLDKAHLSTVASPFSLVKKKLQE